MSESVSFWVAFGAGVLSFASPCVLPLFPSYLSYLTGLTYEEMQTRAATSGVRALVLVNSLFFIAGFSAVFVALGASFSYAGKLLFEYQNGIRIGGGVLAAAVDDDDGQPDGGAFGIIVVFWNDQIAAVDRWIVGHVNRAVRWLETRRFALCMGDRQEREQQRDDAQRQDENTFHSSCLPIPGVRAHNVPRTLTLNQPSTQNQPRPLEACNGRQEQPDVDHHQHGDHDQHQCSKIGLFD